MPNSSSRIMSKLKMWLFQMRSNLLLNPKPGHHDYVWTDDMHEESVYSDCPKYSSGSVEIWGAIIFYGKIDLVFIECPTVQGVKRKFKARIMLIKYWRKKYLNWMSSSRRMVRMNGSFNKMETQNILPKQLKIGCNCMCLIL